MAIIRNVVALTALVAFHGCVAQPEVEEALRLAAEVDAKKMSALGEAPPVEAQVEADAKNAQRAASMAKEAVGVANTVAQHSVQITEHAKYALKDAHAALHRARVNSDSLDQTQKDSLRKAEKKLKEATASADYGQVKKAKVDKRKKHLKKKMREAKAKQDSSELEDMRKEIKELRRRLAKKDKSGDAEIEELEQKIKDLEKAEKKEDKADSKSHDEMKAEIERLREKIDQLEDEPTETEKAVEKREKEEAEGPADEGGESLDIDTNMPFGDLEPFGREDTAQELTEDSIKESDEMVDQLERAEIAEEKRAVFRALTRLRGAAITSFDGVARSQTGNIDNYNMNHQWRDSHPIHHLADEESDINKWAFPDNADFLQKTNGHGATSMESYRIKMGM